jgi:hypothetical protein
MAEEKHFQYRPKCSEPNCDQPAAFKVGALWTDGTSRELKNYGLSCQEHRRSQLERARKHRAGLRLADGESVGEVSLFFLEPNRRDTELSRTHDPASGS